MANFSKEEKVMFDDMLEGFDAAMVASKMVTVTNLDQTQMERTGDIMWFPMPYIMPTYAGNDATAGFTAGAGVTQLSVPGAITTQRHAPWVLTARELRDAKQAGRISKAAYQRLTADINLDLLTTASLFGSNVVRRTVAATGYDDLAIADAAFTEIGVPRDSRWAGIAPRDYNNMAGTLGKPQTSGLQKTATAFEKAYLGDVAGFETYKLDYGYRLTAALGVGVTVNGANQRYVPTAGTLTAGRGTLNTDNRFQVISITVTSGTVKVGDCYTIAGVNSVNLIDKSDTGQLKTFRITRIVTGAGGTGTVEITPPIIAADSSPTFAELQYKNVTATPVNGAVMTPLNTASAAVSPFWQGDAMQILPGRLAPQPDSGLAVMSGTTDTGFQLTMTRQGSITDLTTRYRVDALWGSFPANPEMMGIMLFSQ
jgi:P22 coat protein - gene protein 5